MDETRTDQPTQPDGEFAMLWTATPEGASLARRITLKRLRWWGIVAEDAAVVIGELAANAVTHCREAAHRDFASPSTAAPCGSRSPTGAAAGYPR